MSHLTKPKTSKSQTAQAVRPAAICSAWTATSAALPQEIDAPYDLVWWWVPNMDEPVADWWDIPNDSTHWMPWEPGMLPPSEPNAERSGPVTDACLNAERWLTDEAANDKSDSR